MSTPGPLVAQRFSGKPLLQPAYNFRDVPFCSRDLSGSTLSEITDRQHFVDSIAEFVLLCNEATRRKHQSDVVSSGKITNCPSKPLSIEYIFDRIDTDDPLWGLVVRTDTPMSSKGRASNLKSSPQWRRGMLQGFITVTTFTQWKSSFRFDSLHETAFAYDPDELTELMLKGDRKYDLDGRLAEELEATVNGGDPWAEGIVYPRIAEISLFGGLGCGKKLLQLVIERLERAKASAAHNYDYILLQATENSIPFYESIGFIRVGCINEKVPSPKGFKSSPVETYVTKKNGETLLKIAQDFGVNVWDVVFLNKPMYPTVEPRSWLKKGTSVFLPSTKVNIHATSNADTIRKLGGSLEDSSLAPKWYTAQENETPRGIAKKFNVNFGALLNANKKQYPDLVGHSKLIDGTRIQVSRFDVEDNDYIPYCHWTFPDDEFDSDEPSYMMAMKLNRKSGKEAASQPFAESLAVSIEPYSPENNGVKDLLKQPLAPKPTLQINPKKISKGPQAPKRPTNAYHLFAAHYRSANKERLKGKLLGECTKIITEQWKKLSDDEQAPFLKISRENQAAYASSMEQYKKEMAKFQSENPHDTTSLEGLDTSLLEKVVKLKSTVGATSLTSKFQYWYVLTFIPDLQWVHLIPMRKVGVFGPEYPEAQGRPTWMIVGEDEGKELDTTAAMCMPVRSRTMKNSADADDEQWDIFESGETVLAPIFAARKITQEPTKPKKFATSFALFCADSRSMPKIKDELKGKSMPDCTKILSKYWDAMGEEEKRPYKEQQTKLQVLHSKEMERYHKDLAQWKLTSAQVVDPPLHTSAATPKSEKPAKLSKSTPLPKPLISAKTSKSTSKIRSSKKSTPTKAHCGSKISKEVASSSIILPADAASSTKEELGGKSFVERKRIISAKCNITPNNGKVLDKVTNTDSLVQPGESSVEAVDLAKASSPKKVPKQNLTDNSTIALSKPPLAPIFLKNYGTKKVSMNVDSNSCCNNEEEIVPSPQKGKRKSSRLSTAKLEISTVVSDDANSESSLEARAPRPKRSRTLRSLL